MKSGTVPLGAKAASRNAAAQNDDEGEFRESEAGAVEFGMDNTTAKKATTPVRASTRVGEAALWQRLESPTDAATERSRSASTSTSDHERGSNGTMLSSLFKTALSSASDVAQSFFGSSQFKEFRFKDFCPKLFGKMRVLSGVNNDEYAKSFEKTRKEKFSEGRSGAFMFFSSNERCIVKTTTKAESLPLHAIMPHYVQHLKANPNSLVCRFLGAHCITMYGNELYFVVMLNVQGTWQLISSLPRQ